MTRPNERLVRAGLHLANRTALATTQALEHLAREQTICDGWAARGDTAGRSTDTTSTTEAAALLSRQYHDQTDEIRNTITTIEANIAHLDRLVSTGLGTRTPAALGEPRCRDNQTGRAGTIEWGDVTCEDLPIKAGLCGACYQRERRWRIANGFEAREIEPAQ